MNKTKAYNPSGPNGPSYSAFVTYSTPQEASISILSIDNTFIDDHLIRASFGTTKYNLGFNNKIRYCTFFLKNLDCTNKDCVYLHRVADEEEIIYKVNRTHFNIKPNKGTQLKQKYL